MAINATQICVCVFVGVGVYCMSVCDTSSHMQIVRKHRTTDASADHLADKSKKGTVLWWDLFLDSFPDSSS